MPRIKRKTMKHKNAIDRCQAKHLLNGGLCLGYRMKAGLAAGDWPLVRENFMDVWLEHLPGTRPFGWWEFDAMVPRRCLNDDISDLPEWVNYHFGCPTVFTRKQMQSRGKFVPEFETEFDYLQRHSLLTPEEKKHPADELRANSAKSWSGHDDSIIEKILDELNFDK